MSWWLFKIDCKFFYRNHYLAFDYIIHILIHVLKKKRRSSERHLNDRNLKNIDDAMNCQRSCQNTGKTDWHYILNASVLFIESVELLCFLLILRVENHSQVDCFQYIHGQIRNISINIWFVLNLLNHLSKDPFIIRIVSWDRYLSLK